MSSSSPAPKKQTLCPSQLAQKLRHSLAHSDTLLQGLAQLLAQQALNTSWVDAEDGAFWGPLAQKTLHAWVSSETALAEIERWVENIFNRWNGDSRQLEALLSESAKEALRALASRPFSPSPALLNSFFQNPYVRELIRKALTRALADFARRATAPIAPVAQAAQGVGLWAKSAARAALSKAGPLGEMVGAVSSQMERQAEKRSAEFVDAALEKTIEDLVHALSHPAPGPDNSNLRRSLLETALSWRLPQLAREIANADLPGAAQSLQGALAQWVQSEAFSSVFHSVFGAVRNEASSWKAMLERHGLLQAWLEAAKQHSLRQLQLLVHTPAFLDWLSLWAETALES